MTTPASNPPPAPAGAGRRHPDPGLRTALRFLGVGLSVVLVAWGALTLASLLARATEHRSATYAGIRTLEVDLAFESLQVTSADVTAVTLDRSYSWSFSKPTVSQRRDGDRLVVSSSGCSFTPGLGCTGTVRLVVPRDITSRVRASNSGLTLRDLTGDVDASTSNGSVDVSNLTGQVSLRTSNGQIAATGLRSPRFEARTSNGAVRVPFDAAPTAATARTSNGTVELVVPRDGATYRVTATTSNGTREVSVPTEPRSQRSIEAHTSNGTVRVLDRP
jgi:Putative adhesin